MKRFFFLFTLLQAATADVFSQEVMLQGWYWDYPKTAQGKWWVDTLARQAESLHHAGFNYLWLPPLSKTGSGSLSNGYDVKDYFDLGIAPTSTQFGNEERLHSLVDSLEKYGISPVADMIYNHRNGGRWENNGAVEGWIENYNLSKHNSGDACYPSDRFRCILPIGGNTGLGVGTYYFKIHSASASGDYFNKPYTFRITTKKVTGSALPDLNEAEPNGGADCSQGNNYYGLARDMNASVDNGGCGADEFALTLEAADYFATGDTLFIYLTNVDGNYSDHFIYGLWYTGTNSDISSAVIYQTATDFSGLKSNRGDMHYTDFKPNGNPSCLCGDGDGMWFYYDIDQSVPSAADTLEEWTRWMFNEFGMQGMRIDAIKHFSPEFLGNLFDHLYDQGISPKMAVGESYDFDPFVLKTRLDEVYAFMDQDTKNNMYYSIFDFTLQSCLRDACDAFGYDARNVFGCGMHASQQIYRKNIVSFVNNHDFREDFQSTDSDPILAYAYILTNPTVGIPCVYWTDYHHKDYPSYTEEFNDLLKVHFDYVQGASDVDYLNRFFSPYPANYLSGSAATSLIYQLSNMSGTCLPGRDVIVAINFSGNPLKVDIGVNTSSPYHLEQGDTLFDLLGRSAFEYTVVNGSGQVYFDLPARSYSVWGRANPVQDDPVIAASGPVTFCLGAAVPLYVTNEDACLWYQWKRDGLSIAGATLSVYTASETGSYTCESGYKGSMVHASAPIAVTVNPQVPSVSTDGTSLTCDVPGLSYQWSFGITTGSLSPITGATSQVYTPLQGGYYSVMITDAGGCTASSPAYLFWPVGVDENRPLGIGLSPNPFNEYLNLNGLPEGLIRLEIRNLAGQLFYRAAASDIVGKREYSIATFTWPSGVYTLSLEFEREVCRFLAQKQ